MIVPYQASHYGLPEALHPPQKVFLWEQLWRAKYLLVTATGVNADRSSEGPRFAGPALCGHGPVRTRATLGGQDLVPEHWQSL